MHCITAAGNTHSRGISGVSGVISEFTTGMTVMPHPTKGKKSRERSNERFQLDGTDSEVDPGGGAWRVRIDSEQPTIQRDLGANRQYGTKPSNEYFNT